MSSNDFLEDIQLIDGIRAVPSILDVVCQTTGMGFAAVARVTADRWVACTVRDDIDFGLKPGGELPIETTICNEIREHRTVVVIDDVATDPLYCNHHTPAQYGLRSYISMPIILSDGSFFGTLCAIDPRPAHVNQPHIIGMFRLFAQMIADHIEAFRAVQASRTALLDEQETAALREQFIAVLGHDLRNPLAGIMGGMHMLGKETLSPRGQQVLGMVNQTIARMAGLIDNVMDFARGRLGGGIVLDRHRQRLDVMLRQVVSELASSHPDRTILTDFAVDETVLCDHVRVGQLFSNLLGNALTHGAPDQPVQASARVADGWLEVQTINTGAPIPAAAMDKLFAPFSRGEVRPSLQGLGLGLYIAAQIAGAHGGTLTATSDETATVFTFRMPLVIA